METHYQRIIDYIVASGKRIREKAGNIEDIGVTKQFLTEEDIAIERGLKEIIESIGPDHKLFAEEENDMFQKTENLWAADPISGTIGFIRGFPHYAIVVSHVYKNETQFAAIYDPSMDELFTAYKGKGAFLNGERIHVNKNNDEHPITLLTFYPPLWIDDERTKNLWRELYGKVNIFKVMASMGVGYSYVACGRYDGVITLGKDIFVEFAGSLIIREAGGVFTNLKGEEQIHEDDRVFVAGNPEVYKKLKGLLDESFAK